jgi:hypothetical protein
MQSNCVDQIKMIYPVKSLPRYTDSGIDSGRKIKTQFKRKR